MHNTLFKQRSFFRDTGNAMFGAAAASSGSICTSAEFDSWRTIDVFVDSIIADLKTCSEKMLLHRTALRDTRERLFGADSVASSVVDETESRTTVPMSVVMVVGLVR